MRTLPLIALPKFTVRFAGGRELCLAFGWEYGDKEKFASLLVVARRGYIDNIIMLPETRTRLCRFLCMLKNKSLEKI